MRNRSTPIFVSLTFRFISASPPRSTLISLCSRSPRPPHLAAPAAQDAPGESNLGYLLAGTLLTWAGFFAYAVYLWRKNRDLRREVDDLRRLLGERE